MRLGSHIALLCAAVVLPLILFAGYGAYSSAKADRKHLESTAQAEARNIAQLIREDLTAKVATLNALAASTPLQTGDLDGFYHRAHEFTKLQGVNIVLRDLNGQQIVNTRVAPGTPLPKGADISITDRQAIETQSPQVTDIFIGAITKSPLYMVEMPIVLNGKTTYLLGLSIPAQQLGTLLKNRPMSDGRWITLIDGNAAIVARTLSPETAIGRKVLPPAMDAIRSADPDSTIFMTSPEGIRNFAALHRVDGTRWIVAVAVPEDILLAPLVRSLRWTALLAAIAVICSGVLAVSYRYYLQKHAAQLRLSAAALGTGGAVSWKACGVRELDDVGTTLVETERELRMRLDKQEKLLQALGKTPVILRALDGRISFWGEGAEALYGYSPAEALGRKNHNLLATEFPSAQEDINAELIRQEQWQGVLRQRSKAGKILIVKSHWALWRDPFTNEAVAVVEASSDLTAQAAQAAAEEANRAKTAFLGAISHDLRQPFQAIRLFQQVLEAQADHRTSPVVERMGKALTSAEEMLSAMSQFSVLESGVLETKPSIFHLDDILREIVEDCASMASSANLKLRYVPTKACVHTDRVLFKRMVRNLVVNAIRYTKAGGVLIGCRRHQNKLQVQVVDTGVGIPQSKLANIFEAFFQVGDEPQNGTRGLGLGLAIVSRLSHLLHLQVTAASERDKGSVFSIVIDMANAKDATGPQPLMPPIAQPNPALARGS